MSSELSGLIGFVILLALILFRMPIGVAMALVGVGGIWWLGGLKMLAYAVGTAPFEATFPYSLSVLPLFIMMGVFASHSGISRKLFLGANAFVGHLRGGLAMATIGACAGFGSICGSSLATSATMAKVALPEMLRYNYDMRLASASVAAGGTLGIMIPPSLALAMYGVLTQTSIGQLYLAGILPGILGTALYAGAVWYVTFRDPKMGPPGPRHSWGERVKAIGSVGDVVLLFSLVLGGMFAGFFSATEAAAVGVVGAALIAVARRALTWVSLKAALWETATTIGMVFLILVGAKTFGFFIDLSGLPNYVVSLAEDIQFSPFWVLMIILFIYLILGCLLDAMSMMILTIPVVFPVISKLGIDPVWFGILMVTVSEVGLIHPPFGMNLFVVQATRPDISSGTIVRGILPFIGADFVRLALLIAFPSITLYLLG
ncbi:MAG: TRAP transporter large permease [Bradyrhizobiaceae bacterium]|nr:TRAP transporter large permease [Bradyrhizobiaceae bacterium]